MGGMSSKRYPIRVTGREAALDDFERRLVHYGLERTGDREMYGVANGRTAEKIEKTCDAAGLSFEIINTFGRRSTGYRKAFERHARPAIGNLYFCAYCGRLLLPDDVTVDHLYPVSRVRRDMKLQKKLARRGITDVNDMANLVPSCARCNAAKGDSIGLWILRGRLGRHPTVWFLRHTVRIGFFIFLLWFLLTRPAVQEFFLRAVEWVRG